MKKPRVSSPEDQPMYAVARTYQHSGWIQREVMRIRIPPDQGLRGELRIVEHHGNGETRCGIVGMDIESEDDGA